ncbi:MAG: hypothetical protein JRI68_17905 [Deltaproteobacteria bacterium]|nr:hypothetical protein [Deltaproteobacteria bacterium]
MSDDQHRHELRELILARRAAFIASSLSGLALVASPVRSQPPVEQPAAQPAAPSDDAEEPGRAPGGTPEDDEEDLLEPLEPLEDSDPVIATDDPHDPTGGAAGDLDGARRFRCNELATPDVAVDEKVAALQRIAAQAYGDDRHDEAAMALRKVLELRPSTNTLLALGKVEKLLGRRPAARAAWERYLACSAADPPSLQRVEVEREIVDLRAQTAELIVNLPDLGTWVKIDGQLVATVPVDEPLYVDAGHHPVEVVTPHGVRKSAELYFEGGSELELTLARLDDGMVDPMPCLSPHPCLSPLPPDDRRSGVHWGATLRPHVWWEMPGDDATPVGGGAAALVLNVGLSRALSFRSSLFAAPTVGSEGFVMPLGASADAYLAFSEEIAIGTGLAGGYLFAPEASRAEVGRFEPTPFLFVQPQLVPLALRLDELEIEIRVGALLSKQFDADTSRVGLSFLTTSVGLTYLFLPDSYEDWEDEP